LLELGDPSPGKYSEEISIFISPRKSNLIKLADGIMRYVAACLIGGCGVVEHL